MKHNIKYTNQDYLSILNEMISHLDGRLGDDSLSTYWSNISSADPLFHLVHLFAAHKDIENHMIDYRLNESFIGTAREWTSLVRKAKELGYKIPSYRAGSAEYTLKDTNNVDNMVIDNYTMFYGTDNTAFVYVSDDGEPATLTSGYKIRLYQGTAEDYRFKLQDITSGGDKTVVISNTNISITTTYSDIKTLSTLIYNKGGEGTEVKFKEVPNLIEYSDTDTNVYELIIDPQGITCIKFHPMVDLSVFSGSVDFVLTYVITGGKSGLFPTQVYSNENNGLTLTVGGVVSTDLEILFDIDPASIYLGVDPLDVDELVEAIPKYTRLTTLANINEIYYYLTQVQKVNPNIVKVAVFDKYRSNSQGAHNTPINGLGLSIILLDKDNDFIVDNYLKETIENKLLLPQAIDLNPVTVNSVSTEELKVKIKINKSGIDGTTKTKILNILTEALDELNIGISVDVDYLKQALKRNQIPSDIYNSEINLDIGESNAFTYLKITPTFNQWLELKSVEYND